MSSNETPSSGTVDNSFLAILKEAVWGSHRDFTDGSLRQAIFILAVPMIVEMFAESLFAIVDIFFVARLGANAVAVVGITESMMYLIYSVAIGISIGATATVARRIGEKDAEGAAVAATHSIYLGVAASIVRTRPTAVNLRWALDEMRDDPTPERAEALHGAEVERCRAMGEHALSLFGTGVSVLTHCNTGALATGGYGSALGAIRSAWDAGLVAHVWVDETRPLLQGARLTAWELEQLEIPFSVIVDGAAASVMAAGEVDAVLTGADRIAANGDVANKVGTYGLAVAAAHHGLPLYVVAPTSTLDPSARTGADIPIEQRDPSEVSTRFPAGNPAFDITPAALVAAIVTELGVHRAPYAESLPTPVRAT